MEVGDEDLVHKIVGRSKQLERVDWKGKGSLLLLPNLTEGVFVSINGKVVGQLEKDVSLEYRPLVIEAGAANKVICGDADIWAWDLEIDEMGNANDRHYCVVRIFIPKPEKLSAAIRSKDHKNDT